MNTFNARLKQIIEGCGQSQRQIAKEIGISQPTISGWIRGTTKLPDPETAKKLAELFQVSVSWLLYGQGEKTSGVENYKVVPYGTFELVVNEPAFVEAPRRPVLYASADEKLVSITMPGANMEPDISSGDLLLVDCKEQPIKDGSIYCLFIEQRFTVAALSTSLSGGIVATINSPKESFLLSASPRIVGRVVHKMHAL